jgi:hypothetical protein
MSEGMRRPRATEYERILRSREGLNQWPACCTNGKYNIKDTMSVEVDVE